MRIRSTVSVLLFLFFSASQLYSQILQGSVFDRATGKPLKNVSILVDHTTFSGLSDHQGYFTIKGLEPGVYYFRISHIGYEDAVREVVVPSDGLLSMGVALIPSARQLDEEIVLTAQRFERDPFISPASVSVYTREQFLQSAPRSLPDAMAGMPGVWVTNPNSGYANPSIRGLSGSRTLFMMDGIRLNNPTKGLLVNPGFNAIDPYLMERLEIVRGSGSVQYGSDALGGVAQVFSRTPRFSDGGIKVHSNLYGKYASRDLERGIRGELELGTRRVAVSGGFSKRTFGDLTTGENQMVLSPTGYGEEAADVKSLIKISGNHSLTFSWQMLSQTDLPNYGAITRRGFEDYKTNRERQLGYARMTSFYDSKWFSQVKITGSYQQSDENRIFQRTGSNAEITQQDIMDTWGGTVEVLSSPNPFWNFVSGVEYYNDLVASNANGKDLMSGENFPLKGVLPDGASQSNIGLYSLHTLDVLKLRLSFGGRANAFVINASDQQFGELDIMPSAVVGNVSAMYPIHPNIHLTSSFNTGFRSPGIYEFSTLGPFDNGVEVPNDSLGAERSFTSELGLKAKTRNFSGSLVFYRTQLTDLIDLVRSSYLGNPEIDGKPVFEKVNISQAYIQGFEAELEVPVSRAFALYGTLTYTSGNNLTNGEPLGRIPPLNSRLGLRFRSKTGIWSKMEWMHATLQDRLSSAELIDPFILAEGTPAWNVVNLNVGYDFKWGYATIGIQNMLDEAYWIHGSSIASAGRVVLLSLQLGF